MNHVLRVAGRHNATLTLAHAISELEPDERFVITRRWAIGHQLQSHEEIADELGVDLQRVWDLHDQGLQTLGFLWLTENLLPAYLARAEAA
jgi:DNA-directed RNA polymerase sigma subunit (sigma70/sigma32)